VAGIDRDVPIFLTFPTGWRYHRQYRQFRQGSLDAIREAISKKLNVTESRIAFSCGSTDVQRTRSGSGLHPLTPRK